MKTEKNKPNPKKNQFDSNYSILSSVIENSNASIWAIDKNYRLIFGNSIFQNDCLVGLGRKINVGESVLLDILPQEEKKEWKKFYDRALAGEKFSVERERKYGKNNGWTGYHLASIPNQSKNSKGITIVAHDITERKQIENELENSNKRFEDLLKMLPEAIFEIDENLKLTYFNKRASDLFGYSPEELYNGLNGLQMLVPENRESAKKNFEKRLKGEIPDIGEYHGLKKDGSIFPILFHASSFYKNGKLKGVRGIIVDITKQKQAERKFKNIFNNSVVGISVTNIDGSLSVNKAFSEIVGYTQKELNGIQWQEITHSQDIKKNQTILESILKGKKTTARWEKRYIHKKGHFVWVDISTVLQKDENGKPQYFITSIIDITDRKHAEERFERMALILDAAPGSIMIHDFNGKLLYANQRAFDLHGYTKKEFMSLSLQELDTPESAKHIAERMKTLKEKGEVHFEVEHFKKVGIVLPLDVYILLTKWGEKDAIISVASDITLRKQDEKALIESEAKFKTISENSPDAIFLVDIKGNYVYANQSASDLLGYSIEELLKLNIKDLGTKDTAGQPFKELFTHRKFYSEILLRKKDGSTVIVDMNAVILPNGLLYGSCRDLTERKKADEELKNKNAFIEKLIDSSAISTWISDKNGTAIKVNQACLEFFGAKEEDVIDKYNLFKDNVIEQQGFMQEIKNVFKNGEVGNITLDYDFSAVNHIEATGGTHKVVNSIFTPIIDEKGTVTNVIVQTIDLSDIKKVETALKNNEKFLKETQKIANLGIYTLDIRTGIWESSDILDNILGIDKNYDKTVDGWTSLIHPDWKKLMADYFIEDVLGEKIDFDKEYKIIRQNDKKQRWVRGIGRLEFNNSGEPIKMIGTIQDITGTKQVQEELFKAKELAEENEKKYRDIYNNLPLGIFRSTLSGKILSVNPSFLKIYGYNNLEEVQNTRAQDFYKNKNDRELIISELKKKNVLKDYINRERKKDGTDIWVVTNYSVVKNKDGNIIYIDGIVEDITEKKEVELEFIKAKEKAEESDRLKSAFLANMSHEIRTPMNGIIGFANLLKEPFLSGEEQRKYIDIIEKSGQRMLTTINDIIDISKIEAKQIEISVSDFNIPMQIESIISFFKPEANKKRIDLFSEIKVSTNESIIKTDKEKLYAILTNLVKNAIKFCDKGYVEIGCIRKIDEIEFYVKDTGKGIPKNRQIAIFDRFIQADIEDREVREGSGLGLSISKSYVELLGGRIWVKSKKDKGSTFYFTLPYNSINE